MPRPTETNEDALPPGAMWNPFRFAGYDVASPARVDEALRELFSIFPHLTTALGMGLAALSAAFSGSPAAAMLATATGLTGLIVRAFLDWRLKRCGARSHQELIRLFVLGSSISALTWGLTAAILFYHGTPATQMLVMGVSCAFVQGAAGRGYMMPGTALINIASLIGMVCMAGAASGHVLLIPAGLFYAMFLYGFIKQMIANRLRQLRAERTADRLFSEIVEKNELLRIANEALAAKAYEDPLTGLANRRKFDHAFSESLAAAHGGQTAISLMMIDVDHFKAFNDTYGHQAGDACLQILSNAITRTVSHTDSIVARYGGEEFVAILPGVDRAAAQVIAEQIRLAVRFTDLDGLPNSPPNQTVSIGISTCEPGATASRDAMLAAADAALYEAKRQGRNRVCADSGDAFGVDGKIAVRS